MERIPVFVYDRFNGSHDLVFVSEAALAKPTLMMNDHKVPGAKVIVSIPRVTSDRPHRMVVHEDGDNMIMIAVHDGMIKAVKNYMFTKELIEKHIDKNIDKNISGKKRRAQKKRSATKSRFAM